MKRILVVYFSQTGQLRRVVESVCAPLKADTGLQVDVRPLVPRTPYPFPWPLTAFFDQFPEAVHLDPPAPVPLELPEHARYDLILLAYPVWFLSPAPPVTAFLLSAQGRALLRDTPVITLVACRNMWLMAQETVKRLLAEAGARHCDHIALTDRGSALATFITTPRWMLTGRTDAFWGLPPPGIDAAEIHAARRFGLAIARALADDRADGHAPVLAGLRAVTVDERLIASERIGRRSFLVWGRLVRACGPQGARARRPVLLVYAVFLVTMILTVVPASMAIRKLLRPLLARRLDRARTAYEQPSGASGARLADFER